MTTILQYNTIVLGTGAAGYATACRIAREGKKSVAIVTEGVCSGTSRNTGSDKQTYYKLGLGGDALDSVRNMADTLFGGGCVDGDNALCEAALSSRCFLHLAEGGVPFPHNRYGEYVGYKTDHDPYARATSAGPLTSKFMTEALQREADELNIAVLSPLYAIEILKDAGGVVGLLCLDLRTQKVVALRCAHLVLATGGPAGIYADTVYPLGHTGSTGLAVRAGASLQNMTEWQYGLASIAPRWNVSGTYMQVLPRFVSVDREGNEYEILLDAYGGDVYAALSAVILKGYQWPFDIAKADGGSSSIDLLVYRECVMKGRRVYLDFTKNPFGLDEIDFDRLSPEALDYLRAAKACFGTPIARLAHMNTPAIELYAGKGVDITKEYLEIALCAQHNNGGIAVDLWWQTAIPGLYAAGECAGTHGIARPGGSALNAGQVGALRAATHISASSREVVDEATFTAIAKAAATEAEALCNGALKAPGRTDAKVALDAARRAMSDCAAAIRDVVQMKVLRDKTAESLADFDKLYSVAFPEKFVTLYRLRDTLTTQLCTLSALLDYAEVVGLSRGSSLYTDENGKLPAGLEERFRFAFDGARPASDRIQTVTLDGNVCHAAWRPVRPLPEANDVFELVWQGYRDNGNVY